MFVATCRHETELQHVIFAWQPMRDAKPSSFARRLGPSFKTHWTTTGAVSVSRLLGKWLALCLFRFNRQTKENNEFCRLTESSPSCLVCMATRRWVEWHEHITAYLLQPAPFAVAEKALIALKLKQTWPYTSTEEMGKLGLASQKTKNLQLGSIGSRISIRPWNMHKSEQTLTQTCRSHVPMKKLWKKKRSSILQKVHQNIGECYGHGRYFGLPFAFQPRQQKMVVMVKVNVSFFVKPQKSTLPFAKVFLFYFLVHSSAKEPRHVRLVANESGHLLSETWRFYVLICLFSLRFDPLQIQIITCLYNFRFVPGWSLFHTEISRWFAFAGLGFYELLFPLCLKVISTGPPKSRLVLGGLAKGWSLSSASIWVEVKNRVIYV